MAVRPSPLQAGGGRGAEIAAAPSTVTSCPHRPPCCGCPRFAVPGIAASAQTLLDGLARRYGLPEVVVVSGRSSEFRLRARLAIRGRLGSPKIGLFELGTHRVVHIPSCSVHHPLINHVAAIVRRALVDTRVSCFSESAHLGLARYLQVVVERSSQTAQVVLVGNSEGIEPLAPCLESIDAQLGRLRHSLWFNANVDRSNTILGPDFSNWSGPPSVVERFGGAAVHYPPGAFGQSNLDIAQQIIEYVRSQIPDGARVTEFYAGVGAIGLSILNQVSQLQINEMNPHSLHGLELGLACLDSADRDKITLIAGAAGAAADAAAGSDTVIVDPPRKGLDPPLTQFLSQQPPQTLLYVSCSLESLRKDIEQLIAHGRLRLAALQAFNLLPFTDHVESVARFERV
jgi:23S rRNA (uracil1939-C5)-methyltransferase